MSKRVAYECAVVSCPVFKLVYPWIIFYICYKAANITLIMLCNMHLAILNSHTSHH